jgi:hypothetical protein
MKVKERIILNPEHSTSNGREDKTRQDKTKQKKRIK